VDTDLDTVAPPRSCPSPAPVPVPAQAARLQQAELVSSRPGQTLIGDKNYFGRDFEAQLDLERHHGRAPGGVIVRVLQRLLALMLPSGTTSTLANPSCGR
jgi:hypothetical protein